MKGEKQMDIEKALKLIDAGFTAEEIRKMIPQKTEVSPVLSAHL